MKTLTGLENFCELVNSLCSLNIEVPEFSKSWRFNLQFISLTAIVCNNCDTSIQYVQEHYFHDDAKRATDALATGRGQFKGATGTDWMRDPYVHDL